MTDLEKRIVDLLPRLRRYARALMRGDVLSADDLVQDCVERALSRIHLWREGSDLRAWLFTIMHNIYANQMRRHNNGPNFVALDNDDMTSTPESTEQYLELTRLHKAIAELPPVQREILLLVTLEGMRYQDVAKILNVPEGTVMSKLSRTRETLREQMGMTVARGIRRVK